MTRTPRTVPCLVLSALLLASGTAAAAPARDLLSSAPPDAVLLMHLTIREDDPGQKWIFGELTRFLIARAREKEESARIGDVRLFRFSEFCFSLLPRDRAKQDRLLLSAILLPGTGQFGLTYGDKTFQLNIRDEKTAAGAQTALLSIVLGVICEVRAGAAPADGIYFSPARENRGRFSAYYVSDTRAFLATGRELIASALAERRGIAAAPPFAAALELLPKGWDAYGYADDAAEALSGYLREKEKGWATLVLTLLDPARRMGLALDIEDRERCRAVAVFPLPGPDEARALRARLEPVLAMLIAEYLDPRMKAEISYEELPRALRVTANFSDTAEFWEGVFSGKSARKRKPRAETKATVVPAPTAPAAPPVK